MSDSVTYLVVKGTLALLVLASALTWAIVVAKGIQRWLLSRQNQAFVRAFGGAVALPSSRDAAAHAGPIARVAHAGVTAWNDDAVKDGSPLDVRRDLLERSLRQQVQRERRGVETGLPVLASIGSTAPFVGLFGTVFGIIHALQRISGSGSASLDVVAGPIGEALVATGIGIAVAVPAVLAYNFFIRRLKGLVAELEDFADDLVAKAVKSAVHPSPTPRALERDAAPSPRLELSQEASA